MCWLLKMADSSDVTFGPGSESRLKPPSPKIDGFTERKTYR